MAGILDKKTKFLDFVFTQIGKRNLSKNFENFSFFSISDSVTHYSSSNYLNNIICEPPDSLSFDRFSLSDTKWTIGPIRNRFAYDDLYRFDKDTSLYNVSDRYKYVPNVMNAVDMDLASDSFESSIDEYGPYISKIAIDSNRIVKTNFKNSEFYLDGNGVFGEQIADDDPTVSFGQDDKYVKPYSLNVLNFNGDMSVDISDKASLIADKFTRYVINYMFLAPKAKNDNGDIIDLFSVNGQPFVNDPRNLPKNSELLNDHFDQTLFSFFQNAGENILSYEVSDYGNRDSLMKIDVFEVTYSDSESRRKILPLDVFKIREDFWLVGKFSVELTDGNAKQKDLGERKYFPIFGVMFEETIK